MKVCLHSNRLLSNNLLTIFPLLLAIMSVGCNDGNKTMQPTTLVPTKTRVQAPFGLGTVFEFKNATQHNLKAPGYIGSPPHDGMFLPSYTEYEVWSGKHWEKLDIGYDTTPEYYSFGPGVKSRWIIDTRVFAHNNINRTTQVRVKIDDIYSASFTLEDIEPLP
jgi:hypothetical protein